jgi:hypothetical protein
MALRIRACPEFVASFLFPIGNHHPHRELHMEQNEKKPAEVSSDPKVETPLEEADLDIVTGGLSSSIGSGLASEPSCVTSIG